MSVTGMLVTTEYRISRCAVTSLDCSYQHPSRRNVVEAAKPVEAVVLESWHR
jgi:hypothetical protein